MKKKALLIVGIALIALCGIYFLFNRKKDYNIDLAKAEKLILKEYSDLNLRSYDDFEIYHYFGFEEEDSSFLILSNYEEKENEVFNPDDLVIIINSDNPNDYYDELNGFINSNINYFDDIDNIKKYESAIIKVGEKYIYLILGSQANNIKNTLEDTFTK